MTTTTTKPTQSGYYWVKCKGTHGVTKKRFITTIEIVRVAMNYQVRGKIKPMVLGQFWKGALEQLEADWEWSGPITSPPGWTEEAAAERIANEAAMAQAIANRNNTGA